VNARSRGIGARVRALALVTAVAVSTLVSVGPSSAQTTLVPLRVSINPHFITYVPFFIAVDKGYFRDAGIDLQLSKYQTSANSQLPMLARGDLDVSVVVPGPALFNQYEQGFDAHVIASVDEAHTGYLDGSVLMVRKDLVGKIKKPADMVGRNVDGAFAGSPIALLTLEALAAGGLTTDDVKFTTKESAVPDQLAALRNGAVDVQGTTEPTATAIQQQGYATKWLSYHDIMPGYQEAYFGVSAQYAKEHPDAVVKFLRAYLRGVADVNKLNGKLTPDLIATISKWTEIQPDVIKAMGLIPYYGQNGAVNSAELEKIQKFWVGLGLVKNPVPITKVVDTKYLAAARK
jgi:NitT/TauT family transport system substrate-binding protein